LNAGVTFTKAGEQIQVPNVEPFEVPQTATIAPQRGRGRETQQPGGGSTAAPGRRGAGDARGTSGVAEFTIAVTKSTSSLTVEDSTGRVVFHAPVTTGSEHDPLPIGNWKVTTVQLMPKFNYNPDLFWDAAPGSPRQPFNRDRTTRWHRLDRSEQGTLRTARHAGAIADRTRESHGCVRLTNWDVARLMKWAQPARRWCSASSGHAEGGSRPTAETATHAGDVGLAFALGALTAARSSGGPISWRVGIVDLAQHVKPPAQSAATADPGPLVAAGTDGREAAAETPERLTKSLLMPVEGVSREQLHDTFDEGRAAGLRRHEALDIMAPRGTPFARSRTVTSPNSSTSAAGGLTIYQFDPSQTLAYYYAHLDRYASGLRKVNRCIAATCSATSGPQATRRTMRRICISRSFDLVLNDSGGKGTRSIPIRSSANPHRRKDLSRVQKYYSEPAGA
jgi:hypothetical protein